MKHTVSRWVAFALLTFIGVGAQAGHLFTQNTLNSDIVLTAGQGITLPQISMEFPSPSNSSNINLLDFGSGDILRMTLGTEIRTFDFDAMPAGWSATANSIFYNSGNDPALASLSLTVPFNWRIDAVAGSFTVQGFRIYTANGTVNGTGTDTVNQSLVTSSAPVPVFGPMHMLVLILALVGVAGFRQRRQKTDMS